MLTDTPTEETASPVPAVAAQADASFVLVLLRLIEVTGNQPRKRFDQSKLDELTDSIRKNGVLQPILLRPRHPKGYQLVAGERRFRAACAAGLLQIPAIVREMSDSEMLELQIIENLHREDLHELEEAEGYERLMQSHQYTVQDLVAKTGKSQAYIYARLKLCALCPAARDAFYAGGLTASTALLVARIPNGELQMKATKEITSPPYSQEPLSYRAAADHVHRHYMLRLEAAPFPPADADLVPAAGSCKTCPKRSGNDRDLFHDVTRADVCTDPDCFESKRVAHIERLRTTAEAAGKTVLVGKEAKKVLDGQVLKSGYVDLTEKDWTLKGKHIGKTLKQVLGKSAPETILVEAPDGKLREVAKKADVRAALDEKGIQTTQASGRSESDREVERKARREVAYRQALLDKILEQLAEQKHYELEPLAQQTVQHLWHDGRMRLYKRRGWGPKTAPDEIARLTPEQHYYLLIECALVGELHVPSHSPNGKPDKMNTLAAKLKIDTAAIRKQVLAELTAAQKAKKEKKEKKPSRAAPASSTAAEAPAAMEA